MLVRFCVSLWGSFRVFSIFCITSYRVILRHTSLYYVITPVLNTKKLQLGKPVVLSTSPLRRSLFVLWGGWAERKRERAGCNGKGEERTEAFRLFPLPIAPRALSIFFFFDYCYFYRDTQWEPLWRREAIHSIEIYPVDSVIHVLNNWRLNLIHLACRTR